MLELIPIFGTKTDERLDTQVYSMYILALLFH